MAEQLSNTSFTSNLTGWSYPAGSYSQASGWAKCDKYGIGGPIGTNAYMIYQDVDLTETGSIVTATMSADIKWNIMDREDTWAKFRLKLQDPNGTWYTPKTSNMKTGSGETQSWANAIDISTELAAGGDGTWRIGFQVQVSRTQVLHTVYGFWDDVSFDYSTSSAEPPLGEAISDSATETVTVLDDGSCKKSIKNSAVETVYVSDSTTEARGTLPTFRYYLGGYDGKVYAEDATYYSDNGTAIDAYWESKDTDFAETDIGALHKFKTIYKLKLHYMDITANTVVKISISTDGGSTWNNPVEHVLGTGSGLTATKDFDIIITGSFFRFRIQNESSDTRFQFTALEVYYELCGDHWEA